MNKKDLQRLLDAEVSVWAQKPYDQLVEELDDVVAIQRGEDPAFHQFEVLMLEHEEAYVHIGISIDDGRLWRSFAPLSHSFIVHRDGRVEV